MAFNILLVEDDIEIADFVAQGLRNEGFVVAVACDGHAGERALASTDWDVVVLDWLLPGPDGLTLLRQIRGSGKSTPVLFMTGRDAVRDRVEALNAGADDYMVKPFAFSEFLARIHALLRRPSGPTRNKLTFADLALDPTAQRAERAGQLLKLKAREFALLLFFVRHPREALTRTQLYEQVWDEKYEGLSNTLEVHIMDLRKKLEAHGPRLIHTVRGRGYMLGDPAGS